MVVSLKVSKNLLEWFLCLYLPESPFAYLGSSTFSFSRLELMFKKGPTVDYACFLWYVVPYCGQLLVLTVDSSIIWIAKLTF